MKKILSLAVASTMLLGSFTFAAQVPESKVVDFTSGPKLEEYGGAPVDLGIANDEKLIEMLKKEGKIAKDASPAEAEKALNDFLRDKAEGAKKRNKEMYNIEKEIPGSKTINNGTFNGNGRKKGHEQNLEALIKESYDGEVRTDKVLVLLIDYPDQKAGDITESETDMYYEDYPQEHFQDMIFGEDGYIGPNGENYVSMKQYYENQSGGSYTIEGEVAGWYTAENNAEYYGGNYPGPEDSDARPRDLVYEALAAAGQDPTVDLSEYDVWDRDDYDNDGVYNEPDGIIDHLMVIHAGVGEEAGGGNLGGDAIWSHRWNLGQLVAVPGGTSNSDRFDGLLGAYDYTIEPEDGAVGVMAHEFGHDLGLPDEYDTQYTGAGEAVSYWSIMASGSWAGKIGGNEPTGFSPYAKEMLQSLHGGNWLSGTTVNLDDITSEGMELVLDQANDKGTNNDAVRINLPDKENSVNTPTSGEYEYFSGSGNNLDNSMTTTVDLTNATNAILNFKAWYDIEQDWDYASVKVNGESIPGNITTDANPYDQNPGNGITGSSNGWVDAEFDLSAYAGQTIELEFNYWTDGYVALPGFYADDINVTVDDTVILSDDAEGDSSFTLSGFAKDNGKFNSKHYYLVEWRNHAGVDEGLANIRRGATLMSYDPGMVVWYVDESYDNNWTGAHPGDGYLGVVDADQHANYWSDKNVGSTRYQIHDAAFNVDKSEKMFLDYPGQFTMKDNFTKANAIFDDSNDYSNPGLVDAGRNIPNYGLKIRVIGGSEDNSVGKILLFK
ncbi:immune inhibitor A [Clostridium sp. D2Q-11]|uniref:Immune inhibitor A n=1 Tax=Anaeromonas frigoriresistens TaxID=2683708 RepID=A0A942UWZ7_9FIRM|nr:immune inhibitor A domain-containing protein [Anaeromonas frigoriresistens]MBS4537916.1 immune inhibitor A [Anaeromonas frigoriresistens]